MGSPWKENLAMHGGTAKGPKTKVGRAHSRQAAIRHGGYTKESIDLHKESMALIRKSKNSIQQL